MKYTDKKNKKSTVTVLTLIAAGHCVETMGMTFVVFTYDDDETSTICIMEREEFDSKYEKL